MRTRRLVQGLPEASAWDLGFGDPKNSMKMVAGIQYGTILRMIPYKFRIRETRGVQR